MERKKVHKICTFCALLTTILQRLNVQLIRGTAVVQTGLFKGGVAWATGSLHRECWRGERPEKWTERHYPGFIQNKNSSHNIQRLLNLMYLKHKQDSAIVTLHAKKSFDKVNWSFFWSILKGFGFGDSLINQIKLFWVLLSYSRATSKDFILQRSPLHSAETRQNSLIKCIPINSTEHNTCSHTDNILVLQDPYSSMTNNRKNFQKHLIPQ